MSPGELKKQQDSLKIKVSERNLYNWVREKLLPTPQTGNLGDNKGKFTNYPPETPFQHYAAWRMKKDLRMLVPDIAKIRQEVLDWWSIQEQQDPGKDQVKPGMYSPEHFAWLAFYRMAVAGIAADVPLVIVDCDSGMRPVYPRRADPGAVPRVEATIESSKGLEAKMIFYIDADRCQHQIYPKYS